MLFTFSLEENEAEMVFAGLRKLPMEHVEMLVYKLRVQAMQQKQASEATAANEETKQDDSEGA